MIHMASGLDGGTPIEIDNKGYFGIFAGFILLNALVNGLGLAFLTLMTQVGAWAAGGVGWSGLHPAQRARQQPGPGVPSRS
jgi:hypothetical protein